MRHWQLQLVITLVTGAITWTFNNIATAMVSELPAPTKDSTEKYKYWFRVLNKVVGNIARSKSTSLEQSPNWEDAAQAHVEKVLNGQAPVQVVLSPATPQATSPVSSGQPSPYSSNEGGPRG